MELELDIQKIKARLLRDGWVPREGGGHTIFKHEKIKGRPVLPRGRGDLPKGTARSIAKEAGWLE